MKITILILCAYIISGNDGYRQYFETKHKKHHEHQNRQSTSISSNINITLYTRALRNGVALTKANNYANSAYSKTKVTKFTTNGWIHPSFDYQFKNLTTGFLNKLDVNVINFNWATIAGDSNSTSALDNFNSVGDQYLDLLTTLINDGSSANNFHLLGHSIGAHISGYAAQRLSATKNVKVNRLTGLDPSSKTVRNLTSADAVFVDVIHTTDTWPWGTYRPLGHVDFFPNNAVPPQPGCGFYVATAEYCSSYASVNYYLDTLYNATEYLATSCENYEDFKDNECRNRSTTFMGESVNRTARGDYYLSIYLRNQTHAPYVQSNEIYYP